jgi:hypothetical protein
MIQVSDAIRTFLEDFERASMTFDKDLLASQFSDPFMSADPHGGTQAVTKEAILAGIARRRAFLTPLAFNSSRSCPWRKCGQHRQQMCCQIEHTDSSYGQDMQCPLLQAVGSTFVTTAAPHDPASEQVGLPFRGYLPYALDPNRAQRLWSVSPDLVRWEQ